MTKKLRLIILIILSLTLIATISRNAILVWMTIPFTIYILIGLLMIPREICLSANRIISHYRCKADTLITMTLVIENKGGDIPSVQIQESLNPRIHFISKSKRKHAYFPTQGKIEIVDSFQAPRGNYYWEKIQVLVSDPFFLFEQEIELPAEGFLVVLPDELSEKSLNLEPKHTLTSPGLYCSHQPGSGVNFISVREYITGDPLRSIYWRMSARHPLQLFSKEFEREEIADIGLILDGNGELNLESDQNELFETSVQVAASISKRIIRDGNRLSMLVLGDRLVRVFPGTGKQQLGLVLNQLADCKPGENVTLRMIKYLPVKLFPSHSTIILISPLSERDIPAIARLLANGYRVNLVSPDPVNFVSRPSSHPLAIRVAKLERIVLLRKIQEMGVNILDWPLTNKDTYYTEHENVKSDFSPTLKPKPRNIKKFDHHRFYSVLPILLFCTTLIGLLSGSPGELLVIGATLTLLSWELVGGSWSRHQSFDSISRRKYTWKQVRPLVFSTGIGLLLSLGGLQIQLTLPFGIVVIAILLLLFSLNRFFVLIHS